MTSRDHDLKRGNQELNYNHTDENLKTPRRVDRNAGGGGGGLPCDGLASHPGVNSDIPSRFMRWNATPETSYEVRNHLETENFS